MSLSKVGTYAFYQHPNLEKVKVSAPTIEENAFQNSSKLEVVDLTNTGANTIAANAFASCSKLKHLVVRGLTRSTLSATSALTSTPIALGEGGIYVPSDLLDSYKGATNWSTYAKNIYPLGEYPRANFDSLSESWSDILTNPDYATDYTVKDTKTMELTDGTKIKMDLAAFNTDDKADDSGKAKMTWICHGIPYTSKMHSTADTTGGWITRDVIYSFLQGILDKIPQEIKSHIVSVKKTYRTKVPNDETLSSDELIWLPSYKEVGFTSATYIESDGVTYPDLFNSNATRIKYNTSGSAFYWWLRSAYSSTSFSCVNYNGITNGGGANNAGGVVFGFCTD